jgi:Ni,Fe-hydrogenase maturation factor
MARYLEMSGVKACMMVLAIQPRNIKFYKGLSEDVEESMNLVLEYLVKMLDSKS